MATLYLYQAIETGEAARVIAWLNEHAGEAITVRINSPGGNVHEGLAIFNALRPLKPTVYVDGVAASIASLIAMAGQRIIFAENSLMMIHDPWCNTQGNSADLRRTADELDMHRDAMLSSYARTGIPRTRLQQMLSAETWLSADQALSLGFADEIAAPLAYAAHSPESFSGYINTPRELLMPNTHRAAQSGQNPTAPAPAPAPSTKPGQSGEETLEAFRRGMASEAVTQAAHDAVMDELKKRNQTLELMAQAGANMPAVQSLLVRALADPKITTEAFGQQVLAAIGSNSAPTPTGGTREINAGLHSSIYVPATPKGRGDDFVAAASDAIAMRAGIQIAKPHPAARDVLGMSMSEIISACISRSGSNAGWSSSRGGQFRAAMSTSDFPAILENSLGKALRVGYEAEPATHAAWTRLVHVADFKEQSRVILGSAPELLPVAEGGEYVAGSMDQDKSVPYAVGKFGRLIQLTWESLVNDDLGAFMRITQALGQAASRAEADKVYSSFAENSGVGPTMQDSKSLFHSAHGNLATAAAGITADSLGAARILLRRQTAIGGGVLNLSPRFLLVAPEHEQAAEILLSSAGRAIASGANNELAPAWLSKLELIVEARLQASAFYLLASPDQVDTMERAWLEADNGPVIDEEGAFTSDARSYKVRHVFAARWLDWRGAIKVPVTT